MLCHRACEEHDPDATDAEPTIRDETQGSTDQVKLVVNARIEMAPAALEEGLVCETLDRVAGVAGITTWINVLRD